MGGRGRSQPRRGQPAAGHPCPPQKHAAVLGRAPLRRSASYDPLLPLLVDLPGWEAEPADGADASVAGMRAVTVFRTYESGDRRFEVNILIRKASRWRPRKA